MIKGGEAVGSNQVKESCAVVLSALEEFGGSVEGPTLSDICGQLGLTRTMRGNNFANAITELLRPPANKVTLSKEDRVQDGREETYITLSLRRQN